MMRPAIVLDKLKNLCHKLAVEVVEGALNMTDVWYNVVPVLLCYKLQWRSLGGGLLTSPFAPSR